MYYTLHENFRYHFSYVIISKCLIVSKCTREKNARMMHSVYTILYYLDFLVLLPLISPSISFRKSNRLHLPEPKAILCYLFITI